MRKTVNIIDIPIDNVTLSEAVEKIKEFISSDKSNAIYTPNAEIMMDTVKDSELKKVLCEAEMLVADGAGVVLAAKILGAGLPGKVAGIDLTRNSFSLDIGRKIRYYFFGGKPGIAEEAAANIVKDYPGVEIVGTRNGYFTPHEEKEIVESINSLNPDILLVALGGGKQEKWIYKYKDQLGAKVCIGVGGSFDVFAGKAKLAPEFFRKNGLEWLYRLYKEPWRFKRMLKLPKFILYIVWVKLTGKNRR